VTHKSAKPASALTHYNARCKYGMREETYLFIHLHDKTYDILLSLRYLLTLIFGHNFVIVIQVVFVLSHTHYLIHSCYLHSY